MIKKIVQIASTIGVLALAYVGYGQAFVIVARQIAATRPRHDFAPIVAETRSKREAIELARTVFGPDHWAAAENLQIRHYVAQSGYWIYAEKEERLNDGNSMRLTPFALIWRSRGGHELQTATSESATIDLDRPLGLTFKPGTGALRVVHAKLERNVVLRNDRGTPARTSDDLVIKLGDRVEYDEKTLQVTTESEVALNDRDLALTGFGLTLQLRPKDPEGVRPGFDGAQSILVHKNNHIVIRDAGRSGILPGAAQQGQTKRGATPIDVRSDGAMFIELPKPRQVELVGPPAPPAPTYARFARNVRVRRGELDGEVPPDWLLSDNLYLTFLPNEKPVAAAKAPAPTDPKTAQTAQNTAKAADKPGEAPADADSEAGPLTDLALREARATGHAVWLISEAQNLKAYCNELIHKKLGPDEPDKTILSVDSTTKLYVQKVDYEAVDPKNVAAAQAEGRVLPRKVTSVTRLWAVDATLFDDSSVVPRDGLRVGPPGSGISTIVARGPGQMETRPDFDLPVERRAYWQDQLVVQTETRMGVPDQRKITLTGKPKLIDLSQAVLDARSTIVVWLKPKPKETPKPAGPTHKEGDARDPNLRAVSYTVQADGKPVAPRFDAAALDAPELPKNAPPAALAAPELPDRASPAERRDPKSAPPADPAQPAAASFEIDHLL
ncbi:MAG: hypothetical protein KGM43_06710, partial [Planctomycetota bacterium]|nr:hypothetical protein [Planctomycetota bacterium]